MSLVSKISDFVARVGTEIKQLRPEKDPVMSRTDGKLTKITYASGNTKTFVYVDNKLYHIDYNKFGTVYRKTLNFDANGLFVGTTETVV